VEGEVYLQPNMHYLWQQCIVCLPSIDFELEMLVHSIVNERYEIICSSLELCVLD